MKSDRPWVSQLLMQSFTIIVSILAALAVNQWKESHARNIRVADACNALTNEIQTNYNTLNSVDYRTYHRGLQAEYAKAVKGEAADIRNFFETGLHPTPWRDSAWRTLSGSAILMDLKSDIVVVATDVYGAQNSIDKRNEGFLNAIGAPRSDRETPAFARDMTRSISLYLNELVKAEERLNYSYERALKTLKTGKAPWDEPTDSTKTNDPASRAQSSP